MQKGLMRRLLKLFPSRWRLVMGLMVTVMYSTITVAFSYLIREIIDAAVEGQREIFLLFMQISVAMILLNFVMAYFRTRIMGMYTERGMTEVRRLFANKLMIMSFDDLHANASGELLSRGTNDLTRVKQFTMATLPRLIEIPLTGLLALGLLLFFSWQLTLFSLVMVPLLVIGSSFLMKPIAKASRHVQEKLGALNAINIDAIKGAETVKAYNLEATMQLQGHTFIEDSVESGRHLAGRRAVLESFSMGFSIIPFVTTFILGGYFVFNGMMTAGSLLAFINLLNFLTMPLSQMPVLLGEAKRDMAAAERIFDVLDADEERFGGKEHTIDVSSPMVEFKDVSFAYRDSESYAIKNLTLSIQSNETVAFVGPSGGGKSTVVKLLLGYYDTYEGEITLGGHELKTWSLESLRDKMGMVSQDTYLFPDTVKENIRYGRLDASDEDVIEATKQANAHEFVVSMDKGYDTELSELGSSLSGGQKQRLAIARAMLKDAPILVLDEATSALDTESEAIVQDAFNALAQKKTSIVIAHRLSTVKDVDRVFVIDQGTIVESGKPDDLLKQEGLYARLVKKQRVEEVEGYDE